MSEALCVLPHKRTPASGEEYTLPDGTCGVGDGESPVWDLAADGGRPVLGANPDAVLCRGHLHRLTDTIARTPAMVAWMRDQIEPTNSTPDRSAGYVRPVGKEPPAPISLAAVDAADEELAYLGEWAVAIAEQRGETGPDLTGARQIIKSRHTRDGDRRVVGFRPGAPEVIAGTVNSVVRYLLGRIEWVAEQEWVGELFTELLRQRRTHMARWPLGDSARRLRGFRCMACDRETVVVHPPAKAPEFVETPVLQPYPDPPGGIGPRLLPHTIPILDWMGHPVLDAEGEPMIKTTRRFTYSYPMLVVCDDRRCGEQVPEIYWEWARAVAESGRKIRA